MFQHYFQSNAHDDLESPWKIKAFVGATHSRDESVAPTALLAAKSFRFANRHLGEQNDWFALSAYSIGQLHGLDAVTKSKKTLTPLVGPFGISR